MEDIIDIIVTETTNLITITSSGSDEVIDVNIIDNREDIVLNVTPSVVEININSLTSNFGVAWGQITGTLSNQTDLNTALGLKADLVGGKVPSSQLPSYVDDVIEVANYAALPATGETGKIYITLDTNFMYRWSGSTYIEIKDSSAVWGAITGTLSSQTDLQNALNAKFDDPTGDTTQYIAGDGSLITFPIAGQAGTLVREVRNTTGATLTKGTIVYISGATGNKPTVSKAIATGDSTSAQTFGMCQANIANNANGYVVCVGDLAGLDTSAFTEGNQLYLSSTTAGTYTVTKQLAPAHLVYIGIVTRAHPTLGQIEVNIQNGYELYELHDVSITSVANNDGLFYEASTDLWKNKSIATVLGYTPANGANYLPLAGGTMSGAIVGTTATFANAGSGVALGVTQSGASGDGIRITHSLSRAFTIQSSGSGFGILINNDTASTSAPFTIQKQGASVITLTDAGAGTFASSLTASSFVKTSGTSSQFLKADGSVDSSTYVTGSGTTDYLAKWSSSGVLTSSAISYNGSKTTVEAQGLVTLNGIELQGNYNTASGQKLLSNDSTTGYSYMEFSNTGGGFRLGVNRNTAGGILSGSATYATFLTTTGATSLQLGANGALILSLNTSGLARFYNQVQIDNTVTATQFIRTGGTSSQFLMADGSLDSSSYLTVTTASSTYLPLSGGTLTGALSGTSATFSGAINLTGTANSFQVASIFRNANRVFFGGDTGGYFFQNSGNTATVLQIADSGAATFSSSVLANSFNIAANGTIASNSFWGTLHTKGAGSYSDWSVISGGGNGIMWNPTGTLNMSFGGNVGIGTTSPSGKLHVKGDLIIERGSVAESSTITMEGGEFDIKASPVGYNMRFFTGTGGTGSERMRITSGGELYWSLTGASGGSLNSGGVLFRNNSGKYIQISTGVTIDTGLMYFYKSDGAGSVTNTGSISTSGNLTLYNTTSDYRLKQDFKSYIGLDIINKIKTYDYQWKSDNTRSFGVIAHELQEVLPFAVFGVKDGEQLQQVDYSKIVPVMVQAIKDLKKELDILKNK